MIRVNVIGTGAAKATGPAIPRVIAPTTTAVFIMVLFNGLLLSVNGLFMLIAPQVWYEFVPGVTDTGFFNQHFVRDIGAGYELHRNRMGSVASLALGIVLTAAFWAAIILL